MPKSKSNKRSKKTQDAAKVVVEDTPLVDTPQNDKAVSPKKDTVAPVVVEETKASNNEKEETNVVDNEENEEEHNQQDETTTTTTTSKKRSLDEANILVEEEEDSLMNLGKVVMDWVVTHPVVNTLGSFFHQIMGTATAPAEPEDGPPAIDAIIPMMMLGHGGKTLLHSALLDTVSMGEKDATNTTIMTVDEYKKDFAFETLVGDMKTIHSVRLQLYDCYGMDPTTSTTAISEEKSVNNDDDESSKENDAWDKAVQSVQTIVLVLPVIKDQTELEAALEKWTTWIRQQFQHVTETPDIVLLMTEAKDDDDDESSTEWLSGETTTASLNQACQTQGIPSWHFLSSSSSDSNSSPNAVSSVDDFLHSLVERRSLHLKPLSSKEEEEEVASKPSPKRRKVEP